MSEAYPIVVLLSGTGTNLQTIIDELHLPGIVNIKAVICNRPKAFGIERANKANIPVHVIDHEAYNIRADFDQAVSEIIDSLAPKLIVLTGFMRILTPGFVQKYLGKMINLHPSLLPKYPGRLTYNRVLEAGETEHGSTLHFVTEGLDEGPIIFQARVPILPDDTPEQLQQRVKDQEHHILPIGIRWFMEGRLVYQDNQTFVDGELLPSQGIDMTLKT